ncbi:MAG: flippase [candidate division Zixibacteria bacterium]|nr:flippase [candidate division Zixibacteria bacterium]
MQFQKGTNHSMGERLSVLREQKPDKDKSRARLVLKNSGALGLSTVLGKLFYLLLFVFIGRYLGPNDFGKLTFALSFTAMFVVISDLGMNLLTVKEVSKDRSLTEKYMNNLVVFKTFLSVLAFGIVMLSIVLLGYPEKTVKIVFLLGLATFLSSISSGLRWIFQAHLKLEYDSVLNLAQNVLCFGLGYLFLKLGWGIYGIGYSQVFVWILILISAWVLISKKFTPINFEFDFAFWKDLLKRSIPFALMLVFTGLYLNLDTVLLSFFKGDHAVGLYNAANRLVLAGKMIPGVLVASLFPIISESSRKSKPEFDRILGKSFTLMFCLALPISIGTVMLADKLIGFLYGAQFAGSVLSLQILIWGMFCMYLSIVTGNGLMAKGYQKFNTLITGIGLVISLLFNFALIQRFSHLGTSVAILTTEFFVMISGMFYARKLLGFDFKILLGPFSKVVFATLIMSLTLYLTRELNLFLCAGAGILSYLIVLFSLRGLYGYDFYRLKDLIFAKTG